MNGNDFKSIELSDANVKKQDLIIITTNHSQFDIRKIVQNATAVVDTRNATHGIDDKKIVRL